MTKRCKNCGWPNDDSSTTCQKCGSPLDGGMPAAAPARFANNDPAMAATAPSRFANNDPGAGGGDSGENMRRTVSEKQFFGTTDNAPENFQMTQRTSSKQCPNCHYQVREGMNNCPNCGTPLSGGPQAGGPMPMPMAGPMPGPMASPMDNGKKCPKCGRQNAYGARFCNQCGADLDAPAQARNNPPAGGPIPGFNNPGGARGGTVNPWMQPSNGAFCTLKPIAWDGENVEHQPLSFSGSSIVLNRANTDPNNQSITSAEQAVLTYEDGEWYITDKSAMHTTYVMAGRKLKLEKGDTIILGNRLFEFN